jgi:hypothetical protein
LILDRFVCNAPVMRETLRFADPAAPGLPMSVAELIRCGGVTRLERDAAEKAIAQERHTWLQILERGSTNAAKMIGRGSPT